MSNYRLEFGGHGVSYKGTVLIVSSAPCDKLFEHLQRKEASRNQWRPIETATWDNLSKNDRVILNGWNGSVRFANVVDFNGQVVFDDEHGVPLMAQYDGYTHWMPLPKPPTV